MKDLSAFDLERLTHVNYLMNEIHESCNEIYERLIDREFDLLVIEIDNLISMLKYYIVSIKLRS